MRDNGIGDENRETENERKQLNIISERTLVRFPSNKRRVS